MSRAQLIIQPFRHFTYVTAHTSILPSLYLRHSSFSNPSAASPTSQLILQPFFRFSYVTSCLLTSPGDPPMYTRPLSDSKPGRPSVIQIPCHLNHVPLNLNLQNKFLILVLLRLVVLDARYCNFIDL